MILGLGSDIVDIRRIERAIGRHGERFLARLFTPVERAKADRRTEAIRAATYAKRFAAKEAASKALGRLTTPPGMRAQVALTMTDEHPYAYAQVIIEAGPI